MSFFSKIGGALKKVVKVGVQTAPLWSSFIPGGSIATGIIARVASGAGKAKAAFQGLRPSTAVPDTSGMIANLPSQIMPAQIARSNAHHARKAGGPATRHGGHTGPTSGGHGPNRWHTLAGKRAGARRRSPRKMTAKQLRFFGTKRQRSAARRRAA